MKLAREIPTSKTTFETYVETANQLWSKPTFHKQIERCLLFLKDKQEPGSADEISFNVIDKCFGELYDPLKFIFALSLIFLDELKIASYSCFKIPF